MNALPFKQAIDEWQSIHNDALHNVVYMSESKLTMIYQMIYESHSDQKHNENQQTRHNKRQQQRRQEQYTTTPQSNNKAVEL